MIVIYGLRSHLDPQKSAMSNVIAQCLGKVLGLPDSKRAHRFIPMDKQDFYYPDGRSDAYTVIEINMMAGRKLETQKALIKTLFAQFQSQLGIEPVDLEITINEQPPHCWGFRGMTGDEVNDLNYQIHV